MDVEQLEQIAAVVVTAGLVAGNFLLFTPWRNGDDPRRQHPERSILQNGPIHQAEQGSKLVLPKAGTPQRFNERHQAFKHTQPEES